MTRPAPDPLSDAKRAVSALHTALVKLDGEGRDVSLALRFASALTGWLHAMGEQAAELRPGEPTIDLGGDVR